MELRHRIGHPFLRTPTDRERVHPLGRRLLAWTLRRRADEALAAGADPEADPLWRLLTDGASPLKGRASPLSLEDEVEWTLIALGS